MCWHISQTIADKRSVTEDTALRFGHWFGVEPQFCLNLQAQFDRVESLNLRSENQRTRCQP